MTLFIRYCPRTQSIPEDEWSACFQGELEGWDYHTACELSELPGFCCGWYVAERDGRMVGALPTFTMRYDLSTTASGQLGRLIKAAQHISPKFLTFGASCIGSPFTESCPIGLDPTLCSQDQDAIVAELLSFWARSAAAENIRLLGVKDLSAQSRDRFGALIRKLGFSEIASLPMARLPVTFDNLNDYFQTLSRATRKDLRRKLKTRPYVSVQWTKDITDHIDDVMAMYHQTRARSPWAFETLTPHYFQHVLARMNGRAMMCLYLRDDRPVAANLVLIDEHRMIDKYFICGDEGRALNLYFLSWLENIEFCLKRRLRLYQSGQAAHETKLRLGSELSMSWIFFQHQNQLINLLLRALKPLLAMSDPQLLEKPS